MISTETNIKEIFSKHGEVLNISINQSTKQNSAKSYVLVEMKNLVRIIFEIFINKLYIKNRYIIKHTCENVIITYLGTSKRS